MKILLDACISPQAKAELEAAGHDVAGVGDWPEDPGDSAVLARAKTEGRVLVTLDKDFGELGVLRGAAHCGILRLVNFRAAQQGPVCLELIARHAQDFDEAALITADARRVRVRRGGTPSE